MKLRVQNQLHTLLLLTFAATSTASAGEPQLPPLLAETAAAPSR
jgi:hypothetical protein